MTIENVFIEQESSSALSDKNQTARLQNLQNPEKIISNKTIKKPTDTIVLKSIDESKIPKILILTQGRSGSSFLGSEKKTGFSEIKRLTQS